LLEPVLVYCVLLDNKQGQSTYKRAAACDGNFKAENSDE